MIVIRKSHPKSEFATISTKSNRYYFRNIKSIAQKDNIVVLQIAINPDGDGVIEYVSENDYNAKTSDIDVCPTCGTDIRAARNSGVVMIPVK